MGTKEDEKNRLKIKQNIPKGAKDFLKCWISTWIHFNINAFSTFACLKTDMSNPIQMMLCLTHTKSIFERVNSLVCNRDIFSIILITMSQDPIFQIQMTALTLTVMASIK